MTLLLGGIPVLEVSRTVRSAYAGAVLRDLGADVIRLEVPGARTAVPILDADKGVIHVPSLSSPSADQPVSSAAIVVHDLDEGELASLTEPPPGQVRVSVSARGLTDRKADAPVLLAAESGLAWEIGLAGRPPLPAPDGLTEAITGIHGAAAALWLYLRNLIIGETPSPAEVAELDVVGALLGTHLHLRKHYGGRRDASLRPLRAELGSALSPTCLIDAADGVALVMLTEPSQLERAKAALPSAFADEFPTFADVARKPERLQPFFQAWAANRTRRDLLEESERRGLVCAPFLGFDDLDYGGVLPMLRTSNDETLRLPLPWHVYSDPSE